MNGNTTIDFNPRLDLKLERVVDIKPEFIWQAWTKPALLMPWFCPLPWKTSECEIDLRPGGIFRTVMQGPAGEKMDNRGCYLEIVENKKLVWTGAMLPGYRPAPVSASNADLSFPFTAVIALEPAGKGTHFTAIVIHKDEVDQKKHAAMGFEAGWGKALEQLVTLAKGGRL